MHELTEKQVRAIDDGLIEHGYKLTSREIKALDKTNADWLKEKAEELGKWICESEHHHRRDLDKILGIKEESLEEKFQNIYIRGYGGLPKILRQGLAEIAKQHFKDYPEELR